MKTLPALWGQCLGGSRSEAKGNSGGGEGGSNRCSLIAYENYEKNIKVGVVGCGYWGPNLIRNLRQSPDCQLGRSATRASSGWRTCGGCIPEVATTNRFEDVLNDPEIDAVVIATPVRFHYDMAKAA